MKRVLLALALIGLVVGSASADPNDLGGGVLITHHAPGAVYTGGLDWCDLYYSQQLGIDNCDDQITRMDVSPGVWYVVAAFGEEKEWCGTEFGFGQFDPAIVYFQEWGPCLANALVLPTAGWPGPVEGVAVVSTLDTWLGNFMPTYYFVTYNYGEGLIPLDIDPAQNFAGMGNCMSPSITWDAECLGAMGIFMDGIECCPPIPPEPGACCDLETGNCFMYTPFECQIAGYVFYGGDCEPVNPCPQPPMPGACCDEYTGECFFILLENCDLIGGLFLGEGIECEPVNPCPVPPTASCCVNIYECVVLTQYECELANGDWHPDVPDCDPNPCPSGADNASWGSIKSLYR